MIDNQEINKYAETIELRMNALKEKLSDYCDEYLMPSSSTFISSKVKKEGMLLIIISLDQNFTGQITNMKFDKKNLEKGPQSEKKSTNASLGMQYTGEVLDKCKITPKKIFFASHGPVKAYNPSLKSNK